MTREDRPPADDLRPNSPPQRLDAACDRVEAAFAEMASQPEGAQRQSIATHFDTGRNLLFGLLALQNNFLDRDALIDGFNRCAAECEHGLAQLLLDRGVLSPERHRLLEALVSEHLRLHGDDPEKSLAALRSIGSVRQDSADVLWLDLEHWLHDEPVTAWQEPWSLRA